MRGHPDTDPVYPAAMQRGRLRVVLGVAPGAGKTLRLLDEAHRLRTLGVDAVLAFVDTRGRAALEARLAGLEIVAWRRVEHRGLGVDDLDLDAVLARRPALAIVDDVAHTNIPGSRHRKRHEDVSALLDAGVDVLCALDVSHLDSLADVVERATGGVVRETVPDGFLRQADDVVCLDVGADELLARTPGGAPGLGPAALATSSKYRRSRASGALARSIASSAARKLPQSCRRRETASPSPGSVRLPAAVSRAASKSGT